MLKVLFSTLLVLFSLGANLTQDFGLCEDMICYFTGVSCEEKKTLYSGIFPVFSTCVVIFAFLRHAAPQTQHSLHLS